MKPKRKGRQRAPDNFAVSVGYVANDNDDARQRADRARDKVAELLLSLLDSPPTND